MNSSPCPSCGTVYNISSLPVGRQVTCKKCGTSLIVTKQGLALGEVMAAEEPAPVGVEVRDWRDAPPPVQSPNVVPSPPTGPPPGTAQSPIPIGESQSGTLMEYLTFRRMIVPLIIQVIFWFGTIVSVLAGISSLISSFNHVTVSSIDRTGAVARHGSSFSFAEFLFGWFTIIVGPVIVRVYCELLIVAFRINETLTDIKNELATHPPR